MAAGSWDRFTQGGVLSGSATSRDSHLPWATYISPLWGFKFAALPITRNRLAARRRPKRQAGRLPYEQDRQAFGAMGAEDEDALDVAGAAGAGD